jgi:hypothetical protein
VAFEEFKKAVKIDPKNAYYKGLAVAYAQLADPARPPTRPPPTS